jgi:hypothetical protein
MAVVFPDWYVGGFPDRELLLCDLLQKFLDLCTPAGLACTWLPDDYREMVDDGIPVVRVYRGGMGADGQWDAAAMQVAVIAATRADSWALMEYLRQILLSFDCGGKVRRADGEIDTITSIMEMVGPQQIPELNPDFRMVPATFRVECRRDRHLPDYAAIRESLPL